MIQHTQYLLIEKTNKMLQMVSTVCPAALRRKLLAAGFSHRSQSICDLHGDVCMSVESWCEPKGRFYTDRKRSRESYISVWPVKQTAGLCSYLRLLCLSFKRRNTYIIYFHEMFSGPNLRRAIHDWHEKTFWHWLILILGFLGSTAFTPTRQVCQQYNKNTVSCLDTYLWHLRPRWISSFMWFYLTKNCYLLFTAFLEPATVWTAEESDVKLYSS